MKKIITATGNSIINESLKNTNRYIIQTPDIQFEEDLIDVLKSKLDTEILILSENIIKKENIFKYIKKIKQINSGIKIIILLEKENEEINNFLIMNGIKNIFYGNKITISELENSINQNKTTEEILTEEINNLKNLIIKEKISKIQKNKILNINNYLPNIKNKLNKDKIKIKNKIISIIGSSGVGKSIFTTNFSLALENKKILIIDFDILNKSIKTIFGVKEKVAEENEIWDDNNLENLILKINKNIDLISGIDIIFQNENKIEKEKIKNILDNLKNKYEIIILDTSAECFMDYTKEIIKNSDFSILLTEANLIELKKTKKILEIYIKEWKIEKEKIKIIFNKYNKNAIDNNLLKELFSDFKILGYLKLNQNYNYMINKNNNYIDKEIKKEYRKIIDKI